MKRFIFGLVFTATSFATQATPITYEFTSTINCISGFESTPLIVGDTIHGSFTVDPISGIAHSGYRYATLIGADVAIDRIGFATVWKDDSGSMTIANNYHGYDRFYMGSELDYVGYGAMSIEGLDSDLTAFDNVELPTTDFNLTDFDFVRFRMLIEGIGSWGHCNPYQSSCVFQADVDSLTIGQPQVHTPTGVPEPINLGLMGLGLLGLGTLRQRNRRA